MELTGKKVIITGAVGGIGIELTKIFAAAGAELILVERNESEFSKLPIELNGKVHKFSADFTDPDAVVRLAAQLSEQFPVINILINNAGIGIYKNLPELTWEDWQHSFAINVHAPFILTQKLIPNLTTAEVSVVLNIGSGAGVTPMKGRVAYCATKFALRGLSLTLSEEYKDTNLKFMLLTLGSTMTDFGPLNLEQKEKMRAEGKGYLEPSSVAQSIVAVLQGNDYPAETELYPDNR